MVAEDAFWSILDETDASRYILQPRCVLQHHAPEYRFITNDYLTIIIILNISWKSERCTDGSGKTKYGYKYGIAHALHCHK